MIRSLLHTFLLVFISVSYGNCLRLRRDFSNQNPHLSPYHNHIYKIPLTKVPIPLEKKEEMLFGLSQLQKSLNYQKARGKTFLQKSEGQTNSLHHLQLENFKSEQYIGELAIGNNSNTFRVIYDTGSSNIWINSDKCKDEGCEAHKQYQSELSTSFVKIGDHLDVQFGTGELIGEINSDKVFLGAIQIENQKIAEITKEIGGIFVDSKFEGIVGLAYPTMAGSGITPIFDNIMNQGILNHNVFSFYFDGEDGQKASRLILGGTDPSLYQGPLLYFPISDKYYWAVRASHILVNGQNIGICKDGCTVVADTGTTLMTGPKTELNILLNALNSDGSCSNLSDLPQITFVLENGTQDPTDLTQNLTGNFTMNPTEYMLEAHNKQGDSTCFPGFMPLDVSEPHGPLWILGDIFLKKYYSVYDRDNDVLGFALSRPGIIDA